ncbi:hypothetical protein AND_003319 [Anopheles darlingi]|uniref:Uncharacterized protein n=1 Tax=Anopheles darlingi TaxID=43151 RepID=W5JNQ0_ANODA|nr:hypothetical protein AND_003319 [Anopheles darlingi]
MFKYEHVAIWKLAVDAVDGADGTPRAGHQLLCLLAVTVRMIHVGTTMITPPTPTTPTTTTTTTKTMSEELHYYLA